MSSVDMSNNIVGMLLEVTSLLKIDCKAKSGVVGQIIGTRYDLKLNVCFV